MLWKSILYKSGYRKSEIQNIPRKWAICRTCHKSSTSLRTYEKNYKIDNEPKDDTTDELKCKVSAIEHEMSNHFTMLKELNIKQDTSHKFVIGLDKTFLN